MLLSSGTYETANYSVTVRFPSGSSSNKAGLIFNHDGNNSYHAVVINRSTGKVALYSVVSGSWGSPLASTTFTAADDTDYLLEVVRRQSRVQVWAGTLYLIEHDLSSAMPSGRSGLFSDKTDVKFDDFKSYNSDARDSYLRGTVGLATEALAHEGFDLNAPTPMFGSNVAGEGVWRNFVDDDYMVQVGIDHNYGSSSDVWVRRVDRNNGYRVRLEGYSGTKWVYLDKLVNGEMTLINGASYTVSTPNSVKIKLSGSSIKVWIDGTLKIDATDGDIASGPVSLHGYWTRYSNLKIGYDNNVDDDIDDAGDDLVVSEDFSGTSVTVSHDDAGNLVVDGHFRYVYDAWNRLVKVQSSLDADVVFQTAEYDGTGRRIKKVVTRSGGLDGTEVYLYEQGWKIAEVRDGSGNVTKQFIHGTQYVDELVMMRANDKGDLYVHQDANWNVIALTDLGGSVVERYVYSPYGEVVVHQETSYGDRDGDGDVDSTDKGSPGSTCAGTVSGSCRILDLDFDGDYDSSDATLFDLLPQGLSLHPGRAATGVEQPFAHQGLLTDADIGSYQNRFRTLISSTQRFVQRDPAQWDYENLSSPQPEGTLIAYRDGYGLYTYQRADPVNNSDPNGLCCPERPCDGASAPANPPNTVCDNITLHTFKVCGTPGGDCVCGINGCCQNGRTGLQGCQNCWYCELDDSGYHWIREKYAPGSCMP